jgi:hypothetical protein
VLPFATPRLFSKIATIAIISKLCHVGLGRLITL